ncbi:MAG: histidine phosphatase family protein [Usitatibacteraceae bacterium]
MTKHFIILSAFTFAAAAHANSPTDRSAEQAALWAALKTGDHVVLLRHTETVPGIGDPPGYRLSDCKTQRGLNDAGRAQARAWGKAFARHNIPVGGVFSSVWCRCMDTARIAFGKVESWPALNSHFDSPQSAAIQADQTRGGIPVRMQKGKNLLLIKSTSPRFRAGHLRWGRRLSCVTMAMHGSLWGS